MTDPLTLRPRATYRLQLTKDFTFRQAEALAPYLQKLGISHVYLSPVLKARPGSTHGYDTTDHRVLNPELGTRADFEAMAKTFRQHDLGLVLDIVPNHMGIGGDANDLWLDVLEWGEKSRYANWFDIDWAPAEPSLRGKVLMPFLGRSFGEALVSGGLELRYDTVAGSFAVWAEKTHKLPICPDTYGEIVSDIVQLSTGGDAKQVLRQADSSLRQQVETAVARLNDPENSDALAALIEKQNWRAARYSVAADDINYRRFFIVSDLAAIRVEREDVFDHVHQLTFELVAAGLVDGLRVDHIDGLFDPKAYCLRVREKCPKPVYFVVEKILAPHETVRPDWQIDGTTGYEFATAVAPLLADPAGDEVLTDAYVAWTGLRETLPELELAAKKEIIDFEMAAELDAVTRRVRTCAAADFDTLDLTRNALRNGLREVVAQMPVYRAYVDEAGSNDIDRQNVAAAVGRAKESEPKISDAIYDFIERVMTLTDAPAGQRENWIDAAQHLQQYTGPVMAKGLEDTALYRYNRLISLSDVGERPDHFSTEPAAFHDWNKEQQRSSPGGLLTSSTHDTKRGEDVRARISVLSSIAAEWAQTAEAWRVRLEELDAPPIDRNDLWYLFQMLLGAWPVEFGTGELEADRLQSFKERLTAAMIKSLREAKLRTSWSEPDEEYEGAVTRVIEIALDPTQSFLPTFRQFEQKIGWAGAQNGIIAAVLKLTIPGVPDIYQGAELWEQSMVDPDNRRPVDFALRAKLLEEERPLPELIANWQTGAIKQQVLHKLLQLRAEHPALFAEGEYRPVDADPEVFAFTRSHRAETVLVAVRLYPGRGDRTGDGLKLPQEFVGRRWQPVIGETAELDRIFELLPVTVLLSQGN